jgi:anti-sigma factor RsiW
VAETPDAIAARVREIKATSRANRLRFAVVGVAGATSCFCAGVLTAEPAHGLAAAGLSSDIVGALLLAAGLMLPKWLVDEMGATRFDANPFVQAYWAEARKDAVVAATLLVSGFVLQALSATLA